jgi:hypothetical protein
MRLRLNFTALLAISGLMLSSAVAQQPPEKPKELKVLRQYVGNWTSDVTSKPAVWNPEEEKYKTSNHAEFVLDDWFLHHIEVNHVVGEPNKLTKSLFLWTYDSNSRKYIQCVFQSTGFMGKWTGTWSAKEKTLTTTILVAPPDTTA